MTFVFVGLLIGSFAIAWYGLRSHRQFLRQTALSAELAPSEGEATAEWKAAYQSAIRELDEQFPAALVEPKKPARILPSAVYDNLVDRIWQGRSGLPGDVSFVSPQPSFVPLPVRYSTNATAWPQTENVPEEDPQAKQRDMLRVVARGWPKKTE